MKKILGSALLFVALCAGLTSCSNGDYIANPDSNGNNSVNPLKPLTVEDFKTWGTVGTKFSVKIDGALFSTDSVLYSRYPDTTGAYNVVAYQDNKIFHLHLKDTYKDNIYNMGLKQYNTLGQYFNLDSQYSANAYFQSAMGNSGELFILQNDSLGFSGKFYFQGVNGYGNISNFTEGFFNCQYE